MEEGWSPKNSPKTSPSTTPCFCVSEPLSEHPSNTISKQVVLEACSDRGSETKKKKQGVVEDEFLGDDFEWQFFIFPDDILKELGEKNSDQKYP